MNRFDYHLREKNKIRGGRGRGLEARRGMAAKARLEALEAKLQALYAKGGEKNEYVGGFGGGHLHAESFEAVQAHEEERRRLAAEVKEARAEMKRERASLKERAAGTHDAGVWTSSLLRGDERFTSTDGELERDLAQATYGLVSAADFRQKKEEVEAAHAQREEAAAAALELKRTAEAAERKERKKQKRKAQASKLSFEDEDGDG